MIEPSVTINGHALNDAQAMTVRCAIEAFASDLIESGLGDDAHGVEMRGLYLRRISELRTMMRGATP